MKTYTLEELSSIKFEVDDSLDTDNDGQVVIYTGIYLWSDKTFRSEPEHKEDE